MNNSLSGTFRLASKVARGMTREATQGMAREMTQKTLLETSQTGKRKLSSRTGSGASPSKNGFSPTLRSNTPSTSSSAGSSFSTASSVAPSTLPAGSNFSSTCWHNQNALNESLLLKRRFLTSTVSTSSSSSSSFSSSTPPSKTKDEETVIAYDDSSNCSSIASDPSSDLSPRSLPEVTVRASIQSPEPDHAALTSWRRNAAGGHALILPPSSLATSVGSGSDEQNNGRKNTDDGGNGSNVSDDQGNKSNNHGGDDKEGNFMSAVNTETLQNLMRSLFYIPLTEGGCALGFFTRVCMRDLASQWTDELQEALTDIAGKETKDLDDTWACGFVTSCSVFRKGVNVTDQLPLVSALTGKTFLFDFDNVMNYNFSDPFTDVAFVQLTPTQIWQAQSHQFNFLPMNLSLYHDIYDKRIDSLVNGKDVVIAKQLQGYVTKVTKEKVGGDSSLESAMGNKGEKTIQKTTTLLDDAIVNGVAPAVNRNGELVGISQRKYNDRDVLLPSKMLSAAIAADLNSQIGASEDPSEVYRPEWMDFKIGYTDLHDLGLLVHPLAHNNEQMVDFIDWPFYETWFQRAAPVNQLTFVLTDNHLYLRPEEEFLGDETENRRND